MFVHRVSEGVCVHVCIRVSGFQCVDKEAGNGD